jgi:hypothetical protein
MAILAEVVAAQVLQAPEVLAALASQDKDLQAALLMLLEELAPAAAAAAVAVPEALAETEIKFNRAAMVEKDYHQLLQDIYNIMQVVVEGQLGRLIKMVAMVAAALAATVLLEARVQRHNGLHLIQDQEVVPELTDALLHLVRRALSS